MTIPIPMKSEQEIKDYCVTYANESGYKLNPNENFVNAIVKGLSKNATENGAAYCPCRRQTGNAEEDKAIVCPCDFHKEEIEKDGKCHCMLFFKGD